MKENGIAKTLQIIGWAEMVAALIITIFADVDEILGIDFGAAIWVSAFITCMVFQGFAEIIDLLHKNGKKQDAIIDLLKDRSTKDNNAPKTVLQDIESNLPNL